MDNPSFFSVDEVQCNCGCGFYLVKPPFYFKMNLLRCYAKVPLHVTSWCRCEVHNRNVGGSDTSSHPLGWAADILIPDILLQFTIAFYAGKIGFRGIGFADDFLHLDDDPAKSSGRIWTY